MKNPVNSNFVNLKLFSFIAPPSAENEIYEAVAPSFGHNNEAYEIIEAVPVKSTDQQVHSLEDQLIELNHYESLKLPEPQHVSQLPPIGTLPIISVCTILF